VLIFRKAQFTPPLGHRDPFSHELCNVIGLLEDMSKEVLEDLEDDFDDDVDTVVDFFPLEEIVFGPHMD
jgi:hypothetical protein